MPSIATKTPEIDPARVRAIVFDLGNVLIRLDNDRYGGGWPNDIGRDREAFEQWVAGQNLWYAFETGAITTEDFVGRLGTRLGLSPKQVLDYWNSILRDFVPGMVAGLEVLRKRYPLYILSNTNAAHIDYVRGLAQQTEIGDYERFFEQAFYSYELHSIKPEPTIYREAQARIGMAPGDLLFVDDKIENVEAARAAGWQAIHLAVGEDVFGVLSVLKSH